VNPGHVSRPPRNSCWHWNGGRVARSPRRHGSPCWCVIRCAGGKRSQPCRWSAICCCWCCCCT